MPFLLRSISSRLFQGDPFEHAAASDEVSAASGGYGGAFLQEEHATTPRQAHMLDKNNVSGVACESPRSVLEPLVSAVQHARATASSCLGRFLCSPCSPKDEGCIWDEWDDGSPFRVLIKTVEGAGEPVSRLGCAQSQREPVSMLGCTQSQRKTASTLGCGQSQHIPDACYQSWQRQLSDSSQDTEDEDEDFDMFQSIFSPASRRFLSPSKSMGVEVRMTSHESIFSTASSESSFCNSDTPAEDFLKSCFLCNCTLAHDQDIYMYRGDRAFCSMECRNQQIFLDEGNETCFGAANWYSDL